MQTLNGYEIDNIIKIEKDDNGNITHYSINSIETNRLTQSIISNSSDLINERIKNGIPISAGSFLGVKLLAGYGRKVNLKIVSIEKISCDFNSEFLEAGINQTLHRLILTVNIRIKILMPTAGDEFIETSKLLLSESIIVGKIPEIYLKN
jgi:sporulation protein YunB